jgi:Flp pilus assembly protein TadD
VAGGALLVCAAGAVNYYYARLPAKKSANLAPPAAPLLPPPPPDNSNRVRAVTQHLEQHPRDRPVRYQLAHLYFQDRDYARALRELAVLERDDPRDPEVFLRKAVVLRYDGQLEAAEQEAVHALALKPDYDLAETLLGEIALDRSRPRDALRIFDHHLKRRPDFTLSLLGKGRALEQLIAAHHPIQPEVMLAPVERAVQLEPDNAQAVILLARLKFGYVQDPKGWVEAEQLALRGAGLDPKHPQPYITLAQIYLARAPTPENLQKAGEYAAQAGTLDLKDPRPAFLLGRVSFLKNDLERATKALELSVRLKPMPEAVSQLAMVYLRAGNKERADHYSRIYQRYSELLSRRDALLSAREKEPGEARHYHELAKLYLEAGQPDMALGWLRVAKSLSRQNVDPVRERLAARAEELRRKGGDGPLLPVP